LVAKRGGPKNVLFGIRASGIGRRMDTRIAFCNEREKKGYAETVTRGGGRKKKRGPRFSALKGTLKIESKNGGFFDNKTWGKREETVAETVNEQPGPTGE